MQDMRHIHKTCSKFLHLISAYVDSESDWADWDENLENERIDSRRANESRQQRQRVSQAVSERRASTAKQNQTGLSQLKLDLSQIYKSIINLVKVTHLWLYYDHSS